MSGLRFLVVDNKSSNRSRFQAHLSSLGYDCSTATCGEEAIGLARENEFDIIFMDLKMPHSRGEKLNEYAGLETTRQIHEIHPRADVVALTGDERRETKEMVLAAGMMSSFLPKHLPHEIEFKKVSDVIIRLKRRRCA